MSEGEHTAVDLFSKANEFWSSSEHVELSPLGTEHMEKVLAYAKEHPEEVAERGRQLDMAIRRFNRQKTIRGFEPYEINSKRLAEEILEKDELLPTLAAMPSRSEAVNPFFAVFTNLIGHGYYTFMDKPELSDPKILITGLIVDGYGVALRAKRAAERKHSVGKDHIVIVNALCEMVQPGLLQSEMYLANWFKPDYGLSQSFCDRIAKQFGELKPLKS